VREEKGEGAREIVRVEEKGKEMDRRLKEKRGREQERTFFRRDQLLLGEHGGLVLSVPVEVVSVGGSVNLELDFGLTYERTETERERSQVDEEEVEDASHSNETRRREKRNSPISSFQISGTISSS